MTDTLKAVDQRLGVFLQAGSVKHLSSVKHEYEFLNISIKNGWKPTGTNLPVTADLKILIDDRRDMSGSGLFTAKNVDVTKNYSCDDLFATLKMKHLLDVSPTAEVIVEDEDEDTIKLWVLSFAYVMTKQ